MFKQIHKFFGSSEHNAGIRGVDIGKKLLEETAENGVEVWLGATCCGLHPGGIVSVIRQDRTRVDIEAARILICTGAQENALLFDGCTLPGVMGAGAAQTMTNVNWVLPGKRILMIGSGNVGVIVSYQLMQAGADVVAIVEGAPRIGAYGVHAAKVRRAGVPFYLSHTIVKAEGHDRVERAVIAAVDSNWKIVPGSEKAFDVDLICIAAGLCPRTELGGMCGLRLEFVPALGGWMPIHDADMQSTVDGIYVAGDTAGVEEANTAMDEGRLAGIAMAASLGYITEEEASVRKQVIRERLSALRQGPFGEKRLRAKAMIVEKGSAKCRKTV